MIPVLSPTEQTARWLCAVLGIDHRVFVRNSGCRTNTYARFPSFVAQRSRVWAVMRAVWGWSYPTIAYVTDSPNHSTVMDRLKDDGYMADGVLEELARWAHAHYDQLGADAPPIPVYTFIPDTTPRAVVVERTDKRSGPKSLVPAAGRKPGHGYDCECDLCVPLRITADRMAARPLINANNVEPVVRPFFREARRRMRCMV